MLKQPISDVFFDLDHTLWDFERNSALTYDGLFRQHGIGVGLEEFLRHYVPLNLWFWKQYREGRISQETLRYERLKTAFDRLGYPVSDSQIGQLSRGYLEGLTTHTHLVPYCLEVLEYLSGRYRLHIITNGFEEVQSRKLKNSKIEHYFREVVNADRAGAKKPDPRIFRVALEAAGIDPQQGVMIGDSTEADILGARAVGLQALHYNVHGEAGHAFCPIIYDLREIKTFL
ncbi:YjjG family noncanonical pyrimidine nucleotidase [Robiginitalea marina]|uniref:YjjG family noncanonical pyrimidine nucleotidase n=1 Tax=Robiginitalea marina TaxID=2954105 RepID=A0ABT1B0U7_9FLAO|nr:YjjG family noncanonical pyrimidine nucleotidase [Robiginitalea marina]MCO5725213.1 YjjG family noncanonical pyrimidine nucleotidase [Robiginitalea marina]